MKFIRGEVIFSILILSIHGGFSKISEVETTTSYLDEVSPKMAKTEKDIDAFIDNILQLNDIDEIPESQDMNVAETNVGIEIAEEADAEIQIAEAKHGRKDINSESDRLIESSFLTYAGKSEGAYSRYTEYLATEEGRDTLCRLAQAERPNIESGLTDVLQRINKHILPNVEVEAYEMFFSTMKKYYKEHESKHCGKYTIQQVVHRFYERLVQNEKRTYSLYELSYHLLAECFQKNYTSDMKRIENQTMSRIEKYTTLIGAMMDDFPHEALRCEPPTYLRNENFFELERVVRLIPMNELQISPSLHCVQRCNNIVGEPILGKTLDSSYTINMTYCEFCESAGSSQLCRAPSNSTRYFTGIIAHELKPRPLHSLFGMSSLCNGTYLSRTKIYRPFHRDSLCENCVCKCTNPDVDMKWRYAISLRPQESNIKNNMVVTGIRFHKTKNTNGVKVIYPQIKVAKLSPEGLSRGFWKNVGNYDNGLWPSGKAGVDYAIIGKDENQSTIFNLDEFRGESGYVITGVKFRLRHDRYRGERYIGDVEKSFELIVRLTPCNFTTGSLSVSGSSYTLPDADLDSSFDENTKLELYPRTHLKMTGKNVPTNGEDISLDSKPRQYLEISHSNKLKDVGQTTIPFFDLQPVDLAPALPLSGIDLFHKGAHNNGGFLAFKLTTVNIADLMDSQRYKNLSLI